MSIYGKDGYINIPYILGNKPTFICIVGERQIGKTYGTLKEMITSNRHFILCRRTIDEVNMLKDAELNPFLQLNKDLGCDIGFTNFSKNMADIVKYESEEDYTVIGKVMALSGVSKVRGFNGSNFTDIVLDEFIPESHVKRIKHESDAILNMYVTVNGNRELLGEPPLRLWLLANSNNLGDIVLHGLNLTNDLEDMIRKSQNYKYIKDRHLVLVNSDSSPIATKRKESNLYDFIKGSGDFAKMAFNNEFSYNDTMHVKIIKDFKQLQAKDAVGNLYIYFDKSNNCYYISDIKYKEFSSVYGGNSDELKRFHKERLFYYEADLLGNVYYNTYNTKVQFYNYLGKTL